jgi:hypothetical protein
VRSESLGNCELSSFLVDVNQLLAT